MAVVAFNVLPSPESEMSLSPLELINDEFKKRTAKEASRSVTKWQKAKGKGELPQAAGGNGVKWTFFPVGNEQIKNENYEEHLYDRKDDPNLVTPLHVRRHTLNDHTTSSKHGKKAWKGPSQQKKGEKNSEKKFQNVEKRKKCRQSEKKNKFKSIFLENQVNFFNLILYPSIILSNYKTFFFLYISHICHPHPLDYTFLIGQRLNGKDIERLLPNTNDLRLAYNTKAGYICTPGRLGLVTI